MQTLNYSYNSCNWSFSKKRAGLLCENLNGKTGV